MQAERLTVGAGTVDPLIPIRELVAELELLLVEPVVVVLDDAERLVGSRGTAVLIAELLSSRSYLYAVTPHGRLYAAAPRVGPKR